MNISNKIALNDNKIHLNKISKINDEVCFKGSDSEDKDPCSCNINSNFYTNKFNTKIYSKLRDIEKKNNVKIIYACEAGSKAWGSSSQNSDNDIRFIYVSPKSKYINNDGKDFITCEKNEKYDIYGYDLSKVLTEIKNQDYTPLEWLNSPIQYYSSETSKKLTDIANMYIDNQNVSKAYKALSINNYHKLIRNKNKVDVKSYLLLLKTIFMADYMDRTGQLPPLSYKKLFDCQASQYTEIHDIGMSLLKIKKESEKSIQVDHIDKLDNFIAKKVNEYALQDLTKIKPSDANLSELDKFCNSVINSESFASINKVKLTEFDKKRFELFPDDINYRKKILSSMGIDESEYVALKSIVGPQEFLSLITNFNDNPAAYSTGETINEYSGKRKIENVQNGKFRANLHIHTNNSDGRLSVRQLLDSAAKYADRIADNLKSDSINNLQPFTIAITDHNTFSGCREAVEIIRQNPDKYKNLRVVLGCELSTCEKSSGEYVPNKPYQIHILSQCLNPYDKKTNSEIEKKINNKNPLYASLGNMAEAISIFDNQSNVIFGYAHPLEHQSYKKAPSNDKMADIINNLIMQFKDSLENKIGYVENYYQSYNTDFARNKDLQNKVKNFSESIGLINSGGLDTHGDSIFFA